MNTPAVSVPVSVPNSRFDPRYYQLAVLTGLLVYGVGWLHFEIRAPQAAVTIVTALLTQFVCTRLWKLPAFDPKSALISALSLCLLLRTDLLVLAAVAAVLAIASKFVVRWRGKHVFNPTNFAIVALLLTTPHVWVSPGQWGNVAFFAFLMACLGGLVVNRAFRSDVTYAFLASYIGILFGYSAWLGHLPAVPLHRLENGALLLFAFFMISDPRTTPDHRIGRILFAVLVAVGGAFVPFVLYRTNGLLWSLALFSMLVPLIDRLWPGARYQWRPLPTRPGTSPEGASNEAPAHRIPAAARVCAATH